MSKRALSLIHNNGARHEMLSDFIYCRRERYIQLLLYFIAHPIEAHIDSTESLHDWAAEVLPIIRLKQGGLSGKVHILPLSGLALICSHHSSKSFIIPSIRLGEKVIEDVSIVALTHTL